MALRGDRALARKILRLGNYNHGCRRRVGVIVRKPSSGVAESMYHAEEAKEGCHQMIKHAHARLSGVASTLRAVARNASSRRHSHRVASVERFLTPDAMRVLPGTDRPFVIVESCHSTWLFDEERRRFRRVVKDPHAAHTVSTDWRPYRRLVFDDASDRFLVMLDETGSRQLHSRRHVQHCDRCGGEPTSEMSLEELQGAIAS